MTSNHQRKQIPGLEAWHSMGLVGRSALAVVAVYLLVIVVLVTLALTIGIPLPVGVVGHEGSTIIVVLNGLRLLRTQK